MNDSPIGPRGVLVATNPSIAKPMPRIGPIGGEIILEFGTPIFDCLVTTVITHARSAFLVASLIFFHGFR